MLSIHLPGSILPGSAGIGGGSSSSSGSTSEGPVVLPDVFGQLENLLELHISVPAPVRLPASLWSLPRLKLLSLAGFRGVALLPNCVGELAGLERLHLRCKDLQDLPESAARLTGLTELMWETPSWGNVMPSQFVHGLHGRNNAGNNHHHLMSKQQQQQQQQQQQGGHEDALEPSRLPTSMTRDPDDSDWEAGMEGGGGAIPASAAADADKDGGGDGKGPASGGGSWFLSGVMSKVSGQIKEGAGRVSFWANSAAAVASAAATAAAAAAATENHKGASITDAAAAVAAAAATAAISEAKTAVAAAVGSGEGRGRGGGNGSDEQVACTSSFSVPPSLSAFSHLQTLTLHNVTDLPDLIASLGGTLTRLEVWGAPGQLRFLPPSLLRLRKLRHLHLRGNFPFLPAGIGCLRELRSLVLTSAGLEAVPPSIADLTALEELRLDGCSGGLRVPEEAFASCLAGSLKVLSLPVGELVPLPTTLSNLTSLTFLSFEAAAPAPLPPPSPPESTAGSSSKSSSHHHGGFVGGNRTEGPLSPILEPLSPTMPGTPGPPAHFLEASWMPSRLPVTSVSSPTSALPGSIGQLRGIRTLRVICPHITSLPSSIAHLHSLSSLTLKFNGVLPRCFGSLLSLHHLVLDSPSLYALPDSFAGLTALRTLTLACPGLALLPVNFGQLCSLESLCLLQCTNIATLPASMALLRSLTFLDLSCPQLNWLPISFGQMPALEELSIASQVLTQLPENFGHLGNLRQLRLDCPVLQVLPVSFLDLPGSAIERFLRDCARDVSKGHLLALYRRLKANHGHKKRRRKHRHKHRR